MQDEQTQNSLGTVKWSGRERERERDGENEGEREALIS
jgi:hypothetical protein